MPLAETLNDFCDIFGRNEFDLGEVSFNEKPSEPKAPDGIELTGQIKDFYSLVNFDSNLFISGALTMEIFSLEQLSDAQSGWRWIIDSNQQRIEDTVNWKSNRLVFANRNGDAIFVETDNPLSPVFGTIQKTRDFQLAESLEIFFKVINEILLSEEKDFNLEAETEDFEIKPDFLEKTSETLEKFSPQNKDNFLEFFFG